MKEFKIFASTHESIDKMLCNQQMDFALGISKYSEVCTILAGSLEEAKEQFFKTAQFEDFISRCCGSDVYVFQLDERSNIIRI